MVNILFTLTCVYFVLIGIGQCIQKNSLVHSNPSVFGGVLIFVLIYFGRRECTGLLYGQFVIGMKQFCSIKQLVANQEFFLKMMEGKPSVGWGLIREGRVWSGGGIGVWWE